MLQTKIEPNWEGYGGIAEVDGYAKAEKPSPCCICRRLGMEKEGCAETCTDLGAWQLQEAGVAQVYRIHNEKLVKNGGKRCHVCDVPLIFEDSVLYCPQCLRVGMRMTCDGEAVRELLEAGWEASEVAQLMRVLRSQVMWIARGLGLKTSQHYDEKEKREIAKCAVKSSKKEAAALYGLHIETVNRYLREAGKGEKQRFAKLRQLAVGLFRNGSAVRQVAERTGVAYNTAKRWRQELQLQQID